MKILLTERQINFLKKINENYEDYQPCGRQGSSQIHPEDEIFFKRFYEKFGFLPFPKIMERLGNEYKVGDIYPEHPMAHLNMKSFYLCKSKVFTQIKNKMAGEIGLVSTNIGGSKNYITLNGKYFLRSMFEVILYNTFYLNNSADKLLVDSRKFYGECGEIYKEVDFIYDDKVVIEVAGMEKSGYYEKLESSMKCIESLGYQTKIYKVRELEKKKQYSVFYQQICKDFNFPIDENVLNSPDKLIGHKNLSIDTMKKFIDDNISTATQISDRKTYERLNKYIKQLYNKSVREYRQELGIKQKNK
jgi:hypothetical protein